MKFQVLRGLVALWCGLLAVAGWAQPFVVPIEGGMGGSITGAYSFNGPFTVLQGTNVYLQPGLTNLIGRAITNMFQANLLVVATNGNDTWPGTIEKPVLTLGAAFDRITNGTTLLVMPQVYTVSPSNLPSGVLGAPLRLVNKTNVTIQGLGHPVIFGAGPGVFLLMSNCVNLTVEGLHFDGDSVGHTSNNIASVHATVWLQASSNVTFRSLTFTDIYLHCMLADNDHPNHHLRVFDCAGFNFSTTNIGGTGPDGSLFAGAAHNSIIRGFRTDNSVRSIEIYSEPGQAYTNIIVSQGTIDGVGFDGIILNGDLRNVIVDTVTIKGGADDFMPWAASVGVKINDGVINASINNVSVADLYGPSFLVSVSAGVISNVHFNVCSAVNCGRSGIGGGGLVIQEKAGGGNASHIYLRNSTINGTRAGDGVSIEGATDVYIENNSFTDVGMLPGLDAFRAGVQTFAGNGTVSNLVIRENLFANYTAPTNGMQFALQLHSGAQKVLFSHNQVFNPAIGMISNAAGAELTVEMNKQIVRPVLVAGSYTNSQEDTRIIVPNGSARTNKLAYPYAGHHVTVEDGGSTAAGTNVWIVATGGGTINNGPAQTNLNLNGASMTLEGDGSNNWRILSQSVGAGGGSSEALTNNETRNVVLVNELRVGGVQTNNGDIVMTGSGNIRSVASDTEQTIYGEGRIDILDPSGSFLINPETRVIISTNLDVLGSLTNTGAAAFASKVEVFGVQTNYGDIVMQGSGNIRSVTSDTEQTIYGEGQITIFDPSGSFLINPEERVIISTNLFVQGTNAVHWLKFIGGQTPNRALVLDANTNVTTATGTPDGFKFLRDDNTYAVPPGGTQMVAAAIGNLVGTNAYSQIYTNLGTNASAVFNMMGPAIGHYTISGNSTILLTNMVAFTNNAGARKVELRVRHTGIPGTLTVTPVGPHGIVWEPVFFVAVESTNILVIEWTGLELKGYPSHVPSILHELSSSPIELNALDFNGSARWSITNRVTAATSIIFTNTSDGAEVSATILGEAAGGAARVITVVPQLGHLVANLDTYGAALATSFTFTLTNGNAGEISGMVSRLNGTNVLAIVTRQFAF